MSMLEVKSLTKDYLLGKTTVHALRGVNLTIDKGEFMTIAGPSGSGKTTLLNIIGCLDKPTAGHVSLDGTDIDKLSESAKTRLRREKLGFIFQTFNLIPVLTAFENVELPLLLLKKDKAFRFERVRTVMEMVGLIEFARHRP
ncbi:ABC transporter ATP-binding protein, partial [Planctomycetota bacterium]